MEDNQTVPAAVAFVGALGGGLGATTVAYEMAEALASVGKRVCLVDADIYLGSVLANLLNVKAGQPGLQEWVDEIRKGRVPASAEPYLIHAKPNLTLVTSPLNWQIATVTGHEFVTVLHTLRAAAFDVILVDAGNHLDQLHEAVRIADFVFGLVTDQQSDNGETWLQWLAELCPDAHRQTVLPRASRTTWIRHLLGLDTNIPWLEGAIILPETRRVHDARVKREPLALGRRNAYSAGIRLLANQIVAGFQRNDDAKTQGAKE